MFSPRLEMQGYFLWSFKLDWKPLFQTELEVLTLLMVDKVVTAFHLTLYLFHCIMLLCISQLNLKYNIIYQFINLWPYHRSNFVFHLIERWMRESLYWSQACNHHSKFVSLVGPVLPQCCPSDGPAVVNNSLWAGEVWGLYSINIQQQIIFRFSILKTNSTNDSNSVGLVNLIEVNQNLLKYQHCQGNIALRSIGNLLIRFS